MAEPTLKTKAAIGLIWNTFQRFGVQGFNVLVSLLIARKLMPADYGLMGMLAIFMAVSVLLVEGGFSRALIQKTNRTEEDYSTVFFFNLMVAVSLYLVLFIAAPFIAQFYKVPELTILTRVLSLSIIIKALSIVQYTRLMVKMDYKTPAIIAISTVVASGAIGVFMAYRGFGVWALVGQHISSSLFTSIALFYHNRWLPRFVFNGTSFKPLFSFSVHLIGAGLVATIVNNSFALVIGKLFTVKDVGFYTNARQYPELLASAISGVTQEVAYPVLASVQNQRDRFVTMFRRWMSITAFFTVPALAMFALLAEPFVRFFLGDLWMPVVPLIQWLCFARMITPMSSLNLNILNAMGRSDLFLKVDLSKLPMTIIALVISAPFGIQGIVIGHFVTSFLSFFVNAYLPGKMLGFGAVKQIKEMIPVFCATLLMLLTVFLVTIIFTDDFLQLIFGGTAGVGVYLATAYWLKMHELDDIREMIQTIFFKKANR